MRLLLIYPDLNASVTNYTGSFNPGIASLGAAVKERGHEVSLFHLTQRLDEATFRARIRQHAPDLVGFSVNSHYARRLGRWVQWAQEESGQPVIVGGIHATLDPAQVAALPGVGYTCLGEGEEPLGELCDALAEDRDPTGIANLWVRRGDDLVRNELRPLYDLDKLPPPDYTLFDFEHLFEVRRGYFPFIMSRGCAFRCSYCSMHALRDQARGKGRFWRFMQPERAAYLLRDLMQRYKPDAEQVTILDAILFPNRRWLAEFAPLYRELIGKPFDCNMRADFVDDETARLLADMGCAVAKFGVESGDEYMTSDVLTRNLTLDDLRRGFAHLKRVGVQRWSYNMVGLPEEDLRRALKTVRLNAELEPELALPFIFYPYPGTRLFEVCAEGGFLTEREFDQFYEDGAVTRLPDFAEGDILFVNRYFHTLIRLYQVGLRWPPRLREAWVRLLDGTFSSPLFPRRFLVRAKQSYRGLRHRVGEFLVHRSPRLYRLLGGSDPVEAG